MPGDPLVWVIFFADLLIFSVFFAMFARDRASQPAVFAESQRALYQSVGLTNTLLLLLGSLFVVFGLNALRAGHRPLARRGFILAMACGITFCVVKIVELSLLVAAGYRAANQFFIHYFSLTAIHFLHVWAGLVVLAIFVSYLRRSTGVDHMKLIESGCGFWHLVDLLWILMFSLFYLAS